jgi:GTP-binding protein
MPSDEEFMELLDDSAAVYNLVITKADAVKPSELKEVLQNMEKTIKSHAAAHPSLIVTSAIEQKGMDELQAQLAEFALPE